MPIDWLIVDTAAHTALKASAVVSVTLTPDDAKDAEKKDVPSG